MTGRVNDLAEFLLARIAEDEVHARAASIGSEAWRLDDLGETVCWWPPERESVLAFEREHGLPLSDVWRGQTIETAGEKIAPHIARHDPARVLAECEAKRRIVEMWQSVVEKNPDACRAYNDVPIICGFQRGLEHAMKTLALPYADHPDFRDEWRP